MALPLRRANGLLRNSFVRRPEKSGKRRALVRGSGGQSNSRAAHARKRRGYFERGVRLEGISRWRGVPREGPRPMPATREGRPSTPRHMALRHRAAYREVWRFLSAGGIAVGAFTARHRLPVLRRLPSCFPLGRYPRIGAVPRIRIGEMLAGESEASIDGSPPHPPTEWGPTRPTRSPLLACSSRGRQDRGYRRERAIRESTRPALARRLELEARRSRICLYSANSSPASPSDRASSLLRARPLAETGLTASEAPSRRHSSWPAAPHLRTAANCAAMCSSPNSSPSTSGR